MNGLLLCRGTLPPRVREPFWLLLLRCKHSSTYGSSRGVVRCARMSFASTTPTVSLRVPVAASDMSAMSSKMHGSRANPRDREDVRSRNAASPGTMHDMEVDLARSGGASIDDRSPTESWWPIATFPFAMSVRDEWRFRGATAGVSLPAADIAARSDVDREGRMGAGESALPDVRLPLSVPRFWAGCVVGAATTPEGGGTAFPLTDGTLVRVPNSIADASALDDTETAGLSASAAYAGSAGPGASMLGQREGLSGKALSVSRAQRGDMERCSVETAGSHIPTTEKAMIPMKQQQQHQQCSLTSGRCVASELIETNKFRSHVLCVD
eukprot:Opistho-2@46138